jgi:hypothetical protein
VAKEKLDQNGIQIRINIRMKKRTEEEFDTCFESFIFVSKSISRFIIVSMLYLPLGCILHCTKIHKVIGCYVTLIIYRKSKVSNFSNDFF